MAGGHLGTIWASVALDTAPLGAGAARARRMFYALDATVSKSAAQSSSAWSTAGAKATAAFMTVAKGAAIAAGIVGGLSLKMAMDFDSAVRRAGSVVQASDTQMKSWGKTILDLSTKFPQSATEIAEALYWIKSDMPDATDAEQWAVLQTAMKGAVGGVAELEDATEALVVITNAYKSSASDIAYEPAKYMDIMNAAVARGSVTLQDFVGNIGKVVGTATQAKIPFEQIAAAAATLTRVGVPVETTFMALNNLLLKFIKPSAEASKMAESLGMEFSGAQLQAKGLSGMLAEVIEKTGGNIDTIADLFPEIRALKAAFPLTGTAAGEFAKDLKAMNESMGITDEMFKINSESMSNQMKVMLNNLKKPLIELGTKLFPYVQKGIAAVTNILEGKNATFNYFASTIKTLATNVWNFVASLIKVKPLIIGLGVAFAAVKIGSFVKGLYALGGSVGILSKLANTKIGTSLAVAFLQATESVKGFFESIIVGAQYAFPNLAASIGAIALPVTAVAAGLGLLWYQMNRNANEAELAHKIWKDVDQTLGETASDAQPLVNNIAELRNQLAALTPGTADYVAKAQELQKAENELYQVYPNLIAYVDEEGNAHARSTAKMQDEIRTRLNLAGLTSTMKGEAGELDTLIQKRAKLHDAYNQEQVLLTQIQGALMGFGANEEQVGAVTEAFQTKVGLGKDALNALMIQLQETGAFKGTWQDIVDINVMMARLDNTSKLLGGSQQQLQLKMLAATRAIVAQKNELISAAQTAGISGAALPDAITQLFTSADKQLQEVGVQGFDAYLRGLMQKAGQSPELAANLAQGLFNSGTFVATGVASVDAALSAMRARLAAASFTDAVSKITSAWNKMFGGTPKEQAVAINVKAVDEATPAIKKISAAIKKIPPGVAKVKGDTGDANAAIARLVSRASALNGRTLASVNIVAQILTKVNPTFERPEDAGAYIAEQLAKGAAGSGEPVIIPFGYDVSNLTAQWNAVAAMLNAGGGAATFAARDFRELQESILHTAIAAQNFDEIASGGIVPKDVADNAYKVLGAWNDMKGTLDGLNFKLKETGQILEDSTKRINAWQHEIDLNNQKISEWQRELDAVNNSLDYYGSMKFFGEGYMSDVSFQYAQQSAQLQLAILRAEDAQNYELAANLTLQKEKVDRLKEEHDLATSITYDPMRREIEKTLNPLAQVEGDFYVIRDAILSATNRQTELNAKIAEYQAYNDLINQQITDEQNRVWALKVEYDETTKEVQELQAAIDEMGRNAVQRWGEISDAIYEAAVNAWEAAKAMWDAANPNAPAGSYEASHPKPVKHSYYHGGFVPSTGLALLHAGEFVLSRKMISQLSPKLSPVPNLYNKNDITVTVPVSLDGRIIANSTTRITGRQASAYSRSGGKY